MSIMNDPGRPAGSNSPCPVWCDLPGDHDLPHEQAAEAGTTARREHSVTLLDDLRLGHVAAVRVDDLIVPTGPELVGPVLVEVVDIPSPLDREQFADLVDALVRAEGHVAELYGTDRIRRSGAEYRGGGDL